MAAGHIIQRLFMTAVAAMMVCPALSAGPKAIGAEFAFTGININYQHTADIMSFHDISLGIDFCKVLDGESRTPGVRFNYIKDYIIAAWIRTDYTARCFAGPGVAIGYLQDRDKGFGAMLGICGNVGAEFCFRVPVCLSVSLMPVLAGHLASRKGDASLDIYNNGILQLLSPRVGIRYSF